jgi:hypothetical protein
MKKLLFFLVVLVAGKLLFDRFGHSVKMDRADQEMAKIAAELNQKLPQKAGDYLSIEKAEYTNRTLRFSGNFLQGRELTPAMEQSLRQSLRQLYCNTNKAALVNGIGVEYQFRKTGLRSINDKVTDETWTVGIQPAECK